MAKQSQTIQYAQALQQLNQQLEKLNIELKKAKQGTAQHEAIQEKAKVTMEQAAVAAQKLSAQTKSLYANNKNHTKSVQAANAALGGYDKAVKNLNASFKTTKTNSQGFFDSFKNGKIGSTLGTVVRFSGVALALGATMKLLKTVTIDAFKVFADLEQKFANIQAVTAQTAKEFEPLKDKIFDVAGTTVFTAGEISGLVLSLSKLGLKGQELITAIGPISNAAQALGESLDKVGESVVKIINQFGLSTSQAANVADTLVAAINNTALSFETFNTSIQYVGPLAAQAGLSLQETAAAMGVLADNGFSASRIGTGLRQVLLELGGGSENLIDQLKKLGKENIGVAEAMELVGARAAGQLLVLVKNTDEIERNADAFLAQGTAMKASAVQSSTYESQMKILNSAFEEFLYTIGDVVAQSNLFIEAIGLFSEKGYQAALAMRTLSSDMISAEDIAEVTKAVVNGSSAQAQAFYLQMKAGKQLEVTFTDLLLSGFNYTGGLARAIKRQKDELQGLTDIIEKSAAQQKNSIQVQEAADKVAAQYGSTVAGLRDKFQKKVNVDKQVVALETQLSDRLFKINTLLAERTKLTQEQINALEGEKQGINQQLSLLSGLYTAKEDIKKAEVDANKAKREALDAYRDELALRKEDLKLFDERIANEQENAKVTGNTIELENAVTDSIQNRTAAYEKLQAQLDELRRKKYISETEYATMTLQLKAQFIVDKNEIDKFARDIAKIQEDQISNVDILSLSDEQYESLKIRTIEKTLRILKDTYNLSNEELNKLQPLLEILMFGDSDASREKKSRKDAEEKAKKAAEDLKDILTKAAGALNDIIDEYADVNYENLKRRMDAELELIQQRYDTEEDILKSQLDSNLISQSQYENQLIAIQKRRIAEENKVDKAIFDAEKKRDKADATSDFLEATAMAFINEIMAGVPFPQNLGKSLLTTAIAGAKYGAQMNAISMRKFYPKKFAEGGLVYGPSHAEGGVPFRVAGQGGYEMEGGEFIVNKQATARHYQLLQAINGKNVNYTKGQMSFATGGMVVPKGADESTMLLKQIADASILTSINSARPVRAYVSSKDLSNDEAARKTRERNKLI